MKKYLWLILLAALFPSAVYAAGDVAATYGTTWRDGSSNPEGDTPLTAAALNNELARSRRFVIAEDKDVTSPPWTCDSGYNGYAYLITGSPSGAWSTASTDDIAICTYQNSTAAWVFVTPKEGYFAHVNDENTFYLFDGADWGEYSSGTGGGGASTYTILDDSDISGDAITTDQAVIATKITNDGAGAAVEWDLPTCAAGRTVTVEEEDAYTITLDPNAYDDIHLADGTELSDGISIISQGTGYCKIKMTCRDDTHWWVDYMMCAWVSTGA